MEITVASRELVPGVEITPTAEPVPMPPPPGREEGTSGTMIYWRQVPLTLGGDTGDHADTNTNRTFGLLGQDLPADGFEFVYCPEYAPRSASGHVMGAASRAVRAWNAAIGKRRFMEVERTREDWAYPTFDGRNVIEWARLNTPDGNTDIASAVILYTIGTNLVEADILLNAAADARWFVNWPIQPGSRREGSGLDVQSALTHELGHVLGLADLEGAEDAEGDERDATMYCSFADGQLNKQTLTPGDIAGARAAIR
ncbi:MAG: hypothetical protein HYU66_03635 [Armatimonadetes bacterium]|nr:hypothetical protein [Armatimonadota bacterium]